MKTIYETIMFLSKNIQPDNKTIYIGEFLVAFVINHLNKEDEDENKKNDVNKILFCFLSHFPSNQFRNNQK